MAIVEWIFGTVNHCCDIIITRQRIDFVNASAVLFETLHLSEMQQCDWDFCINQIELKLNSVEMNKKNSFYKLPLLIHLSYNKTSFNNIDNQYINDYIQRTVSMMRLLFDN